jgi:ABC-2 type transport system ATP-binding protein
MPHDILQISGLSKHFGQVMAVQSISFSVQPGEILGFLGPNGAGKTTTIGMILGLIHPDAGEIRLFDEPVTVTDTHALKRVGALLGPPALLPYLSARRNLELIARLSDSLPPDAIDQTLSLVGLSDAADRGAGHFSTGMKQRLGLAIALLHNPELLILDEPTNGMDPGGMHEMRQLLRGLAERGVTIFFSSHLLHEVEQTCDRVIVLNKGVIIAEGPFDTLLGDRQVVRVRVDSPVETAALLMTLPGASAVQPDGAWVSLRHPSGQDVNAFLANHGIFASEIHAGRPDLETLFLELTQTEKQPAQSGL